MSEIRIHIKRVEATEAEKERIRLYWRERFKDPVFLEWFEEKVLGLNFDKSPELKRKAS